MMQPINSTPPRVSGLWITLAAACLYLFMCVLQGCSSVHKSSETIKLKEDSTAVIKSDSIVSKSVDSSTSKKNLQVADKSSSENLENYIHIDFDSGYLNNGATNIFIKDSGGGTIIESNKPIKGITKTAKQSKVSNDIATTENQEKKEVKTDEVSTLIKSDSTHLAKDLKIKISEKKKFSLSWWWLLLLLIPAWIVTKYLYVEKKLPLSGWLAKALFFV